MKQFFVIFPVAGRVSGVPAAGCWVQGPGESPSVPRGRWSRAQPIAVAASLHVIQGPANRCGCHSSRDTKLTNEIASSSFVTLDQSRLLFLSRNFPVISKRYCTCTQVLSIFCTCPSKPHIRIFFYTDPLL